MITVPKRIQRQRTKGWSMPEGAVYVGRPTKWGNPFQLSKAEGAVPAIAVDSYKEWLQEQIRWDNLFVRALSGRDLACWCPLVDANGEKVLCHADVLLEIANRRPGRRDEWGQS